MWSKWSKIGLQEFRIQLEVRMRLPGVYQMSEDEVVEFLVEGNMVSDNHFMYFLLKAIC